MKAFSELIDEQGSITGPPGDWSRVTHAAGFEQVYRQIENRGKPGGKVVSAYTFGACQMIYLAGFAVKGGKFQAQGRISNVGRRSYLICEKRNFMAL
jgi:hypothetical protein